MDLQFSALLRVFLFLCMSFFLSISCFFCLFSFLWIFWYFFMCACVMTQFWFLLEWAPLGGVLVMSEHFQAQPVVSVSNESSWLMTRKFYFLFFCHIYLRIFNTINKLAQTWGCLFEYSQSACYRFANCRKRPITLKSSSFFSGSAESLQCVVMAKFMWRGAEVPVIGHLFSCTSGRVILALYGLLWAIIKKKKRRRASLLSSERGHKKTSWSMRHTLGGIKPKEKERATSVDRLCPSILISTWVNGECGGGGSGVACLLSKRTLLNYHYLSSITPRVKLDWSS